jgi:hypothetical protein
MPSTRALRGHDLGALLGGGFLASGIGFGCRDRGFDRFGHDGLLVTLRRAAGTGGSRRGDEFAGEGGSTTIAGIVRSAGPNAGSRIRTDRNQAELHRLVIDSAIRPHVAAVRGRQHLVAPDDVANRNVSDDLVGHILENRLDVVALRESDKCSALAASQLGALNDADLGAKALPSPVGVEQRGSAGLQSAHANVRRVGRELLVVVPVALPVIAAHSGASGPHELRGPLLEVYRCNRGEPTLHWDGFHFAPDNFDFDFHSWSSQNAKPRTGGASR